MKFKSPPIHRTALYRAKAAYANMKARCLNSNGKNPSYRSVRLKMSLDEWIKWAVPAYEMFMESFPRERPCAARKHDAGHYEIGNIEIISVSRNSREQPPNGYDLSTGKRPCTACKKVKPLKDFYKRRHRVTSRCKDCLNVPVA